MKETRRYGLFELRNGKWVRIHEGVEGRKSWMVRVCQDALLAPFLGRAENARCLKPLNQKP